MSPIQRGIMQVVWWMMEFDASVSCDGQRKIRGSRRGVLRENNDTAGGYTDPQWDLEMESRTELRLTQTDMGRGGGSWGKEWNCGVYTDPQWDSEMESRTELRLTQTDIGGGGGGGHGELIETEGEERKSHGGRRGGEGGRERVGNWFTQPDTTSTTLVYYTLRCSVSVQ